MKVVQYAMPFGTDNIDDDDDDDDNKTSNENYNYKDIIYNRRISGLIELGNSLHNCIENCTTYTILSGETIRLVLSNIKQLHSKHVGWIQLPSSRSKFYIDIKNHTTNSFVVNKRSTLKDVFNLQPEIQIIEIGCDTLGCNTFVVGL